MPHFDIVKRSEIKNTFRVSKIQADFDVKPEHANERFVGEINLPEKWNIGVIVGSSGTGKRRLPERFLAIPFFQDSNTHMKVLLTTCRK